MSFISFYIFFFFRTEDYLKYGSYVIWFNMKWHDEEQGTRVPEVIEPQRSCCGIAGYTYQHDFLLMLNKM
jgi:hypothetical protein